MYKIILISASILLFSAGVVWIVRENYFDLFIYNKSMEYGYWIQGKTQNVSEFGLRSKDIEPLYEYNATPSANIKDKQHSQSYTIAVIGDSYVWGLGVRHEDTLSQVLERKLNRLRKTRVLLMGSMGDDAVDNYTKYRYLESYDRVDLYIFVPVNNDFLYNGYRKYAGDELQAMQDTCERKTGSAPVIISKQAMLDPEKEIQRSYIDDLLEQASVNEANMCMLAEVIGKYPKDRVIYFIPDDYTNDGYMKKYVKEFEKNNLTIVAADMIRADPKYAKFWANPQKYLRISKAEDHPSVLAHRMFAEVLYRELLNNPVWKFMVKP